MQNNKSNTNKKNTNNVKNKNNKFKVNNAKNKFKRKNVPFNNTQKASAVEAEEIVTLLEQYDSIKDPKEISSFKDFPLSRKTLKGLRDGRFKIPTDIQKASIGPALKGRDILGAAITGSGKTLAFLIPILEQLYVNKWTKLDGIGAIIISPTRELAYQIFETLKKIGIHHEFSAGLIIGGKNLKFETKRMDQCNIVICTPGRLLQHMDENPLFNCTSTRILVLDEADRCLDLGFQETMNSIIENLPESRQSLLFSATQTKSVKDLARLSLKSPVYVAPSEESDLITPTSLQQNYVVIELEDKITMVWSFIKNHLKQKCIIFLSSCKQVKYIYEIFCKLKPGVSMLALYGTLHQDRRTRIYDEFCAKSHCVLFATDIASRGLHFPVVNWVIHLDCPEDTVAYIHRAGRTARHNAKGESLLVLTPSEVDPMLQELKSNKIDIHEISIDSKRLFSPRVKIEGFLAQSTELKATAQRAFVAYIKSVFLMKNKKIFKIENISIDAYARSLGLVVTPRVRFLQRLKKNKKEKDNENKDVGDGSEEENEAEAQTSGNDKSKLKTDLNFLNDSETDDDEDEQGSGLFSVRRVANDEIPDVNDENEPLDEIQSRKSLKPKTRAAVAKKIGKKKIIANRKVLYDEEGNEVINTAKQLQSDLAKEYENTHDENGIDIEMAKKLLKEEDKFDKQRFKALVKAKHQEKKEKMKSKKEQEEGDDFGSESDYEPDLSWLPDPDKIYNKKGNSDNSNNSASEDDEAVHKPPTKLYEKRKKSKKSMAEDAETEQPKTKKQKKKHAAISEDLPLNAAEQLAMQLLNHS